jgi:predicted acylesterase/phospholipase RssA
MPLRYLASASVPFVFPHQLIQGRTMMDGGTVWNTNLASAVERCREMVDKDEDIIMDVIICSDGKLDTTNSTGDTIENFLRSFTVSGYHNSLQDVREFRRAMPNVTYRYFFMASQPLSSVFDLL